MTHTLSTSGQIGNIMAEEIKQFFPVILDHALPNQEPPDAIFCLSYEYLLAAMVKEYCEINFIETIRDFNASNGLTITRAALYPFFVSVSNGHSKSLFHLFSPFYAFTFGPASLKALDILRRNQNLNPSESQFWFRTFDVTNKDGLFGLTIKKAFIDSTFEDIKNNLRRTSIHLFSEHPQIALNNIAIASDEGESKINPIPAAIDSGIKAIKSQSKGTFFKADSRGFLIQASYFLQNLYEDNKGEIIRFEQIVEKSQRPYFSEIQSA